MDLVNGRIEPPAKEVDKRLSELPIIIGSVVDELGTLFSKC